MKAKDVKEGYTFADGSFVESVSVLESGLILIDVIAIDNDCGDVNGESLEYHPEEDVDPPVEEEDYPGLFHGNHYD